MKWHRNHLTAWHVVLAAFYFLTFGGFVAFAIYLPTLLRDEFGLTLVDAGFCTAGFVVLATLMRPVGGWLADKIGGERLLSGVFGALAPGETETPPSNKQVHPKTGNFMAASLRCGSLLGNGFRNQSVRNGMRRYFRLMSAAAVRFVLPPTI